MFPTNGMHSEGSHFKLESNIWSWSLLWDVFMLCVWKINGLMRELLILCRCAKGSASPGYQGCYYAFTWREQGGPPDSSLFPEWCHSCSEGKPDDTNKPGCLLSTFPLPLEHSQKREFFPKVCFWEQGSLLLVPQRSWQRCATGMVWDWSCQPWSPQRALAGEQLLAFCWRFVKL